MNSVPQSVPTMRRHPSQPISKILYKENYHRQIVYQNMYVEEHHIDEEDNDDCWRYSLQPDLSLFNISSDNLNYQQTLRQNEWLEEIFHSTKIEEY